MPLEVDWNWKGSSWEVIAADLSGWRRAVREGVMRGEEKRSLQLWKSRERRKVERSKQNQTSSLPSAFMCNNCVKDCLPHGDRIAKPFPTLPSQDHEWVDYLNAHHCLERQTDAYYWIHCFGTFLGFLPTSCLKPWLQQLAFYLFDFYGLLFLVLCSVKFVFQARESSDRLYQFYKLEKQFQKFSWKKESKWYFICLT